MAYWIGWAIIGGGYALLVAFLWDATKGPRMRAKARRNKLRR